MEFQQSIGLAKKFVQVFLYEIIEKYEQTNFLANSTSNNLFSH